MGVTGGFSSVIIKEPLMKPDSTDATGKPTLFPELIIASAYPTKTNYLV